MPPRLTSAKSKRITKGRAPRAVGLHYPKKKRTYYFHLLETDVISIGRARTCAIRLDDTRASRKHAVVERHGRYAVIRDDESSNGTYVDGKPVEAPVVLTVGMQVQLGKTILVAVDESGSFPIQANSIGEFCYLAHRMYGSFRLARRAIGKSVNFIRKQAARWKRQNPDRESWTPS